MKIPRGLISYKSASEIYRCCSTGHSAKKFSQFLSVRKGVYAVVRIHIQFGPWIRLLKKLGPKAKFTMIGEDLSVNFKAK
jgi:hypothetical protein